MAFKIPTLRIEDWQNLNPREMWLWPAAPKALASVLLVAAIGVAGYFGVIMDKLDELDVAATKQQTLMADYKIKFEQAINLDAYQKQRIEVEATFGLLLRQLPNKAQMEALLNDINQAGLGRGLIFELFRPAAKETLHDFYAEQPIALKLTGTYHDFGAFASAVAHLDRIVTLNDLAVTMDTNVQGRVFLETTATTFRYLDKQEIAVQKAAAAKARAAGKEEK
jgi:type IV pilus assembly protein PilO